MYFQKRQSIQVKKHPLIYMDYNKNTLLKL